MPDTNPYKKPPDNPIDCPCCRAVTHWESVYDKGWSSGCFSASLTLGIVCLALIAMILQLAVEKKLITAPKWNVVQMRPDQQ